MTEAGDLFKQGLARHQTGDAAGAVELYRAGLKINDTSPDAWHLLGVALLQMNAFSEAISAIQKATDLRPRFAEAHGNLGTALQFAGRHAEAEAAVRTALSLAPDTAALHFNLGNLYLAMQRFADAVEAYREAIRLQPQYPEAHSNLGNAFRELEKLEPATSAFETAVAQKPDYVEARYNLANAYRDQGKLTAAEAEIRKTLALRSYAKAFNTLGVILSDQGRSADAVGAFAAAMSCDPNHMPSASNWLSAQQYVAGVTEEALAQAHASWAARHLSSFTPATPLLRRQQPMTVGFISPDLGTHPVGLLSVRMFENLNPEDLHAVVFSTRPQAQEDGISRRIAEATTWRRVGEMNDEDLARAVRDAGIQILFDLSGHTAGHRLGVFARKAAAIQVSWLGYVGTTGVPTMDYVLADNVQAPVGTEAHYVEGIIRLPHGYSCFDPPAGITATDEPPAIENGYVTFGSLNNPAKLSEAALASYASVLARVPNARLLLKFRGLEDTTVQDRLLDSFAAKGIARERVVIEGGASRTAFLETYNRVDIVLDTFPYSGGLTTCEALWMGCPVVTFPGATFAGRHAASYLTHAGLSDLVALDRAEFERLAEALSNDLPRLRALRSSLRNKVEATLCDGKKFARDFTTAMQDVAAAHL